MGSHYMPDWKELVRKRLAPLRLTAAAELDLTEELSQHLQDCYEERLSGGATAEEAYRTALSELDEKYPLAVDSERMQRLSKSDPVPLADARRSNILEEFWRDLRFALRSFRTAPVFVLFVVLTLGLGIGANTTVFTVVNTLLLNPLPVRNIAEFAAVAATDVTAKAKRGSPLPISYPALKDYETRNQVFDSLAGYTSPHGLTWQQNGAARSLFAEMVTANYFSTLGLTPARGRFFSADEDRTPGGDRVAVVNYGTWQAHFGGADDIVGKQIRLNGVVFTVIGVAPRHFIGVNSIFGPNVWVPASMAETLLPNQLRGALTDRTEAAFMGIGRLKMGATEQQAQANLAAIQSAMAREHPDANPGETVTVRPLRDVLLPSTFGGSSAVVFAGVMLLAVVGIVLLIACSNVANLLLARAAARRHEISVRLALGASRGRLVRQLLTESMLLSLFAGGVGVLLALTGLKLLFGAFPSAANFPSPKLDVSVFVFSLLISLAAGFLFGTMPAFRASRTDVAGALKEETRTLGRSRGRITVANILLTGQVAFSFLLLLTAALFLRSIQRAYHIDPGFQTARLATFLTSPGQAGFGIAQSRAFYKEVRDRVRMLPQVRSVAWSSNMPLWARTANGFRPEGWQPRSRNDTAKAVLATVGGDYFETAGIAMIRGRRFKETDDGSSMPVAIVNEKLAHDYWPQGALGKRILIPGEKRTRQVVGVVRNANYTTLGEAPQPCVYVPLAQNDSDAMFLYVRSVADPRDVIRPVQREIAAAAPGVLVSGIRTGSEILDGALFQARLGVAMLSVFGLLALGLASVGLYGIMAYSVTQRRREMGLRTALGASRAAVFGLVLKQGMSVVSLGVFIGFVAALIVGRLLSGMLYGVSPNDPVSIVGAAVTMSAVSLLACLLPAHRATSVDPLTALRDA